MKVRFALIALVAGLATFTAFQSTHSQTNKSTGSGSALTDSERDLLNEINQARANPPLYATYLEKLKPQFSGKQYTPAGKDPLTTEEGWNAVDEAIRFLKALKPTCCTVMKATAVIPTTSDLSMLDSSAMA